MTFLDGGKWILDSEITDIEIKRIRESHRKKFKFLQDEPETEKK